MKTLTRNKTLIGTGAAALALALGITQASAFSFGGIFDAFGNSKSDATVQSDTSANAYMDTRGTNNTSVDGNANLNAEAYSDTSANVNGTSDSANGMLDATVGLNLTADANTDGTSVNNNATVNTSAEIDTDIEGNSSIFARFGAWLKTFFNFSGEATTNSSVTIE